MDRTKMAWDFVTKYDRMIRAMAMRKARVGGKDGQQQLADELYSEAIYRAPSIAENWEEYRGTLYAYMRRSMAWWMHKYMTRRAAAADALAEASQDERMYDAAVGSELEDGQEVYFLLQDLSEEERTVLVAYVVNDMTFQEIADHIGLSKGTVRLRYHAAVKKATTRHGLQAGNGLAGTSVG